MADLRDHEWAFTLEQVPVGILIVNSQEKIAFINSRMEMVLSATPKQFQGQHISTLPVVLPEETPPEQQLDLKVGDETRTFSVHVVPLSDEHRLYLWEDLTELLRLKAENRRCREELAMLVTRDPETGLPNRRAILQSLEPLISRSRRYENPLSVLQLVIDPPEQLDQTFGEGAGRKAIIAVAQLLRDQMRWADLIGRSQTDAFVVILPETPAEAARRLGEKIMNRVAAMDIVTAAGKTFRIRCTAGSAGWEKGDNATSLLKRASQQRLDTTT